MLSKINAAYNKTQWLTDREAWFVFRAAAYAEAVGWTLLIIGVLFDHYHWPAHAAVLFTLGRIHGTLFLMYILAATLLGRSIGLKKGEVVIAGLCSVPPYGTLLFEQWVAHRRKRFAASAERFVVVRAVIHQGTQLLAVQPVDREFWCLPGGPLGAAEAPEKAVVRHVRQLTGKTPKIGELVYTQTYVHGKQRRLELFYEVLNPAAFSAVKPKATPRAKLELDDLRFIDPAQQAILPKKIR